MIKAKPKDRTSGPIDPAKLKGYVERIEAVEAEEADYKATKKDLYVEVKAAGLRPKMVRKIVKERKKTEADKEDEAELELYRAALAMPGATFRSVAKDLGVPRSTLHRLVPRNKNGTSAPKPEDGDDGITGGEDGKAEVDHSARQENALRGQSDAKDAVGHERSHGASGNGRDDLGEDGGGLRGIGAAQNQLKNAASQGSSRGPDTPLEDAVASPSKPVPDGEVGAGTHLDDDLAIPAHLRGPSAANRRLGA